MAASSSLAMELGHGWVSPKILVLFRTMTVVELRLDQSMSMLISQHLSIYIHALLTTSYFLSFNDEP